MASTTGDGVILQMNVQSLLNVQCVDRVINGYLENVL